MVGASKDRRGRLVEWVEKDSFTRLNKLFEITMNEMNHQRLLIARNLLAVIRGPNRTFFPSFLGGFLRLWCSGSITS